MDGGASHPSYYAPGTSTGALVEDIYATGQSPIEVRQLINEINWFAFRRNRETMSSWVKRNDSNCKPRADGFPAAQLPENVL